MSIGSIFNAVFMILIAAGIGLIVMTVKKAGRLKINGFGMFLAIVGIIGAVIVPSSFHTSIVAPPNVSTSPSA